MDSGFGSVEPVLDVDRSLTAHSCGCHCLLVVVVDDVSSSKNTVDGRARRAFLCGEVSGVIQIELTLENLGIRIVTDRKEESLDGKHGCFTGEDVLHAEAGDEIVAEYFFDRRVPENFDLRGD